MTPHLTELRDALAEKCMDAYFNAEGFGGQARVQSPDESFKAGWESAIKALEDAAGDMDVEAARNELDRREARVGPELLEDDPDRFLEGARWQFEADKARIGLAYSAGYAANLEKKLLAEMKSHSDECDMHAETNRLLVARIKQLEARLAEAESWEEVAEVYKISSNALEARIAEMNREIELTEDLRSLWMETKDKLAAAEARIAEHRTELTNRASTLAHYEELLSHLPKVPCEPYILEMAKEITRLQKIIRDLGNAVS